MLQALAHWAPGNHCSQAREAPTGGPGPTPALRCSHSLGPPKGTAHPAPSMTTEASTSKQGIYLHMENKSSARGPRQEGRARLPAPTPTQLEGGGRSINFNSPVPTHPIPYSKMILPCLPPLKPTQPKEWDCPREMPGKKQATVKHGDGSWPLHPSDRPAPPKGFQGGTLSSHGVDPTLEAR